MRLLKADDAAQEARLKLSRAELIPGWGGSFQKDGPDPMWQPVREALPYNMLSKINTVTQVLHSDGKTIYPNPSAYTAAVAILLGIPSDIAPWLLISGRLKGWTEIALRTAQNRRGCD